jgi:hypothetical protein
VTRGVLARIITHNNTLCYIPTAWLFYINQPHLSRHVVEPKQLRRHTGDDIPPMREPPGFGHMLVEKVREYRVTQAGRPKSVGFHVREIIRDLQIEGGKLR